MNLSVRQRRALEAICNTFAPSGDGWPSASEVGVPDAIARGLESASRAAVRAQFLQLLDLWDSRFHSLFTTGRLAAFSSLPPEAREWVFVSWADSSSRRRRGAFQALRKAIGLLYVTLSSAAGERNRVWEKLGFPGPLGAQRPNAPRPLRAIVPETDLDLSCDVCVIGSGAGGATAAAVLAKAGSEVIVLETGGYFDDADFDGDALRGFEQLYAERGNSATWDQSVNLLAGECLGGGTVINYCTSFRTPDDVRAEWAAAGVPWFTQDEYTRSLDAVCARLSVNLEHNRVSTREQVLQRGLQTLGWHCAAMPRNVVGCEQGNICGYCGFGCAIGAKQSAVKTWLRDAQDSGARLYVETRAERIRVQGNTAAGVEARTRGGRRVSLRCRAVVVACGAIHTAALMLRSGLRNEHIGRHLHLHPVTNVSGIFREEIRPWEGTMQAVYSDQFRFLSGNYGVKLETTALQPAIHAAALPWREAQHYRSLLEKLPRTVGIGALVRDRDGGRVTVDSDGHPISHYSLSPFDRKHLRDGFIGAARVLEAAGAELIFSPHAKWCAYEPGRRGSLGSLVRDMDSAGWDAAQVALFSFHIMGTARMGSSPRDSVTNPEGQSWEVRNLYVMDGSAFPSASGVNPMISIEAMAHRHASSLASRIGNKNP
jgi:long-chain-alcohol oxidase